MAVVVAAVLAVVVCKTAEVVRMAAVVVRRMGQSGARRVVETQPRWCKNAWLQLARTAVCGVVGSHESRGYVATATEARAWTALLSSRRMLHEQSAGRVCCSLFRAYLWRRHCILVC